MISDRPESLSSTPPTTAGRIGPPRRPAVWPIWFGVVVIILAVVGSFLLTATTLPLAADNPRTTAASITTAPRAGPQVYATPLVVACVFGNGLAGALIIAGIALLYRKAWAAALLLWWTVPMFVLAVGFTVLFCLVIDARSELSKATASGGTIAPSTPGAKVGAAIGYGMISLFLFAILAMLPTFSLIWFTRPGVRKEVASWRPSPVS